MYFGTAFGSGTEIGSLVIGVNWQDDIGSDSTYTWPTMLYLTGGMVDSH